MTSNVPAVSITQHLPDSQMGRSRVSFSVNLGEIGFRRFLHSLPDGQADHYESRATLLKEPSVEVVLPGECMDTFDLENPLQALEEMGAICRHHRINTTTYILDHVAQAVRSVRVA